MISLTKVCLSQLRFLHVFLALGHYARDMFASKTDQKRKQQKGESTCPRYTLRRNQLSSEKYFLLLFFNAKIKKIMTYFGKGENIFGAKIQSIFLTNL